MVRGVPHARTPAVRACGGLSRLLRGIVVFVLQLTNLCIWIWLVDDTQFVTSSSSSGGVANVVKVCYQGKYSFSSFSSLLSRFFPLFLYPPIDSPIAIVIVWTMNDVCRL